VVLLQLRAFFTSAQDRHQNNHNNCG
jgi:hypothetical protein